MNNIEPLSSLISLTVSTTASAVPVEFARTIPFLTYPICSGCTGSAISAVSRLIVVLVFEYEEVKAVPLYGSVGYVEVGALNGPYL